MSEEGRVVSEQQAFSSLYGAYTVHVIILW